MAWCGWPYLIVTWSLISDIMVTLTWPWWEGWVLYSHVELNVIKGQLSSTWVSGNMLTSDSDSRQYLKWKHCWWKTKEATKEYFQKGENTIGRWWLLPQWIVFGHGSISLLKSCHNINVHKILFLSWAIYANLPYPNPTCFEMPCDYSIQCLDNVNHNLVVSETVLVLFILVKFSCLDKMIWTFCLQKTINWCEFVWTFKKLAAISCPRDLVMWPEDESFHWEKEFICKLSS